MSTAEASPVRTSAARRFWRSFRRWRRGRPFWGGLLCILSGAIYFLSVHLDLSMRISFGPQGFLTWVIPLVLLLCGVLIWATPAQRIFYGVLAAATAVYGLIGLNLGGFFLGMLLGIAGGALGASWTPVALERIPSEPTLDGPPVEPEPEPDEPLDSLLSGPLSDTLPTSRVSPLAPARPGADPAGETTAPPEADPAGETTAAPAAGTGTATEREPGTLGVSTVDQDGSPLPRRSPRLPGLTVVVLTALAIGLATVPRPTAAAAAPCTTSTAAPTARPTASRTSPTAPSASPTTGTAPDPSPSPSPSRDSGGGLLSGIVNGIKKILGLGDDPTPTPSPSASPSTTPSTPDSPRPSTSGADPEPSPSASTGGCAPGAAAPDDATVPNVLVNKVASTQTTALLVQNGLSYKGIAELRTAGGGTIRCLQFDFKDSESTPFELSSPFDDHPLDAKASQLTISGNVSFYTTKISGLLFGAFPTTYTPDNPPLIVTSIVWFTSATLQLVFVTADSLVAVNLDQS